MSLHYKVMWCAVHHESRPCKKSDKDGWNIHIHGLYVMLHTTSCIHIMDGHATYHAMAHVK